MADATTPATTSFCPSRTDRRAERLSASMGLLAVPRRMALVLLLPVAMCFAQTRSVLAGSTTTLSIDDAIGLALGRASTYQASMIGQSLVGEDVRQARAAFLPRVSAPTAITYNSPERGGSLSIVPGGQSFINLNAIREYQSGVAVIGELDLSGRLAANLRRNRDLLAAARAGTEVARRDLIVATQETYYAVALTAARLQFAERNVATAQEFESVTVLLTKGGEVSAIDRCRARLQTATRLDEQEQARAAATIAGESLRFLIGFDRSLRLNVEGLEKLVPPLRPSRMVKHFVTDGSLRRGWGWFHDSIPAETSNDCLGLRSEEILISECYWCTEHAPLFTAAPERRIAGMCGSPKSNEGSAPRKLVSP